MRHHDLPKWPYLLFKWYCKSSLFEEIQGDLEENFLLNLEEKGKNKARKIYILEILGLIRPSVMKKSALISGRLGQLTKNYLITSVRAVKHNPGYILSNIIGLAIALTFSTIGYFYFRYNHTYNEHYSEAQNLYKVHGEREADATLGSSSIAIGPALEAAGYEAMRYHHLNIAVRKGDKLFQEGVVYADPGYMQYFELMSVSGKKLEMKSADEVFISQEMALKIFDDVYPIGELVIMVFPNQKERSFVVKDVFVDPPQNVSFHFPMITSFDNYVEFYDVNENDWTSYIDGTFVHLKNINPEYVGQQMESFLEPHNASNPDMLISKFRLDNILVWPSFESSLAGRSFWNTLHPASVWGTVSTAFAILLLACFNFINTSIALSGKRLKEIAVRKVMGGNRRSTIAQFMTENSMMVLAAVVLSIVISYYLIPAYNSMMTQEIVQVDLVPLSHVIYFGVGLILFVALLSGAYPSFHISKFSSLEIFRDKLAISGRNRLMIGLLTFQFALCFYNLASLFVNVENAYYQETLDQGHAPEQIINIPLNDPSQLSELEARLNQIPEVLQVAGTKNLVGFSLEKCPARINGEEWEVVNLTVGHDYPEILKLRLIKGSLFPDSYETSKNQIVINQMLEDEIGADLLNKPVAYKGQQYTVVGVVEDFNLRPMMFDNQIKPTILRTTPEEEYQYASVITQGDINAVNDLLEEEWYAIFPQQLYQGFLQEEVMDVVRETNGIMIKISVWSSIITILISALGLYTLIALNVQRRSKEFGIRKVLGASSNVIVGLLGKDLYWILGIAMVLGLSGAYAVITPLFDTIYAYHVELKLSHYLFACLALFSIVLLTIGFKVNRTGKMNPVEQLRME